MQQLLAWLCSQNSNFQRCSIFAWWLHFVSFSDAHVFVLVQKTTLNWKWITVNLPQASNFTLKVPRWSYTQEGKIHKVHAQRAQHTAISITPCQNGKITYPENAYWDTHTCKKHMLSFKSGFKMLILNLCTSMTVFYISFVNTCLFH